MEIPIPYKDKIKAKEYKTRWNKKYYLENKQKEKARIEKRKKEYKKWFYNYKRTLKCSICGEDHPACLDFHHENKETKTSGISCLIQRYMSKDKIMTEIKKCKVLCANCHRKLHSR